MAPSSLRSLRSATLAVGATGALSICIPVALVAGPGTFTATPHPSLLLSSRMVSCGSENPLPLAALRPGQCVLIRSAGFTGREAISVTRRNRPGWSDVVRADRSGRLTYRFQLDRQAAAGSDLLTFIGESVPAEPSADGPAVVGQVALCRFEVTAS